MWIGKRDEAILHRVVELAIACNTLLLGHKMTRGFIDHWENTVDNQSTGVEQPLAQKMVSMHKIVFNRSDTTIKGRKP